MAPYCVNSKSILYFFFWDLDAALPNFWQTLLIYSSTRWKSQQYEPNELFFSTVSLAVSSVNSVITFFLTWPSKERKERKQMKLQKWWICSFIQSKVSSQALGEKACQRYKFLHICKPTAVIRADRVTAINLNSRFNV